VRVLKKATEVCRYGSKNRRKTYEKPAKKSLLNDMIRYSPKLDT